MTFLRFILNVTRVDGNLTSLFLGCLVNGFIRQGLTESLFTEHFCNGLRQCRFALE